MPKVSVIMPVYNRERCVSKAVESVFAQTYKDYEFIVIDDGSTDGTAALLAAHGDRLQVITQPNRGAYAARNAGLKRVRGEYVAFLDSDDAWRPGRTWRLSTATGAGSAFPQAGISGRSSATGTGLFETGRFPGSSAATSFPSLRSWSGRRASGTWGNSSSFRLRRIT